MTTPPPASVSGILLRQSYERQGSLPPEGGLVLGEQQVGDVVSVPRRGLSIVALFTARRIARPRHVALRAELDSQKTASECAAPLRETGPAEADAVPPCDCWSPSSRETGPGWAGPRLRTCSRAWSRYTAARGTSARKPRQVRSSLVLPTQQYQRQPPPGVGQEVSATNPQVLVAVGQNFVRAVFHPLLQDSPQLNRCCCWVQSKGRHKIGQATRIAPVIAGVPPGV